jgi:translocation and assembly module TamB
MALLALFAVGIPAVAVATVRSSNAHQRLRELAVNAIRDELGLRASLGRVHIELVPLSLVASDIALDDPIYGRTADAQALRVVPSVGSLLHGRVEIAAIELERANVNLIVREDGVRNLPRIEANNGGGAPTLPFRRLVIRDSNVMVDADPWARGELRGVNAEVRGETGHIIAVDADVAHGNIERLDTHHELTALHARVEVAPDAIHVIETNLAIGALSLAGEDVYVPLPPPQDIDGLGRVRGHVRVGYDLGTLAALQLPVTLPRMVGRVLVDATLSGQQGAPRAVGAIEIEGVRVEQFGIGDRGRLPFHADRNEVVIDGAVIDVQGGGGHVNIDARLGLTPDLPLVAVARPDDLSFAHLMDQFEVSANSIVEWIFDGELHLEGSLADPEHIDLSGPITLQTRDFVVSKDAYHARPVRPVIAIPRGNFVGRWSIRPDGVRFSNLVADLPRSRIFADVLLGFHNQLRVDARAEANLLDISPLDGFPMAGIGPATCRIEGLFQDPHVTGHIRLAGFEFNDFRLGDIETDADLDRDGMGVTFPRLVAVKRDSHYVGENVYLDFHHNRFAMRGGIQFERMTLADFYHVFGFESDERFAPFQGVLTGHSDIEYTNGFPGDSRSGTLRTNLDLGIQTATLNGYAFENGLFRGSWNWYDWSESYRGGVLTMDHVELRKGDGILTLAGSMERGGVLNVTANADRLALRDLEGIGDRFGELDGIAGVSAQVHGTADRMLVDADIGVHDVIAAGRPLGDGRAYMRLTYQDDPWVQEALGWGRQLPEAEPCAHARLGLAHANWPEDPPLQTVDGPMRGLDQPSAFLICGTMMDGDVGFDVAVGRQSLYPLRGKIHVDDVSLARFMPTLDTGSVPTEGLVRAMVRFDDGGMRDPATLRGQIQVDTLAVQRGDLRLENAHPIIVNIDRGVARLERGRMRGPGVRVRLSGEASLDAGLALEASADVDLATLPRVTPTVLEASGGLAVRLALTGPFTDPEVYGEASLEEGLVRLRALESPLTNLRAHATFSARQILIEAIEADVAGGHVQVAGEASLDHGTLERYAFAIRSRHLSFEPTQGLDVTLGTNINLGWNRGEPLPNARGEVRIEHLAYTHDIALGATIGELSRTQRTEVEQYDPAADWLAIDLHVRNDEPLAVRNNLVDAALSIEDAERPFRIVGTNQRYGMVGDMRFTRGRVFFRNAAFELRQGATLTFDDEHAIVPRFDIHATTEIRRSADLQAPSWRVILDASGTSDAFTIATRSDPDLPQEDILLLLAVGLTRGELETLRGGDLGSTLALEALASVTGIDREVRRAVPVIDDFRLSSAYSVRTGRTEPQVSIGKRIADRVRLSATTGLSEAREFRAVIEAQLDANTSVQAGYDNYNLTSASSFGNVGVDLRWRLEFH